MWPYLGIIQRGSSGAPFDGPKAGLRLKGEEPTAGAILLIFRRVPLRSPGTHREEGSHVFKEKTRTFITVYARTTWVIRDGEWLELILHMPEDIARHWPEAPLFTEPRLQGGFFNVRRTLS
jgi:hypothetical protein